MLNKFDDNIFSTRLGRRIVFLFILAGFLPLTLFAFAMYFQSGYLIEQQSRSTLEDYVHLASGNLFQTLKEGEFRLEKLADMSAVNRASRDYFARINKFDRRQLEEKLPGKLTDSQLDWLDDGRPALTAPYKRGKHVTVSMVVKKSGDQFLAGEFKPKKIWQVFRGSFYGDQDAVMVINNNKVLVSSRRRLQEIELPDKLVDQFSADGLKNGTFNFPVLGESVWISKGLWLAGRYGAYSWDILVVRPREKVNYLPRLLVRSLIVFLAISTLILIFMAVRFARNIYAPLNKLTGAMKTLASGYWFAPVKISRPDEIGDLAKTFNKLREKLQVRLIYLRKILFHMDEPVLVTDREGNVEKVNRVLAEMFEKNDEELAGLSAGNLFVGDDEDLPFDSKRLEEIVSHGDIEGLKLELDLPENKTRAVVFNGSVTRQPDGQLELVILVGKFISE